MTYTYGDNKTVTKDVKVTQAGNPDVVDKISDITEVGKAYKVKGTVVAINNKGFVVGDGTGYVYTYLNATPTVAVNDMVTVSGTTGTYGNIIQFTNTATVTTATSSNYTGAPAATLITEVPDYSSGYHLSTYLEFEGSLAKSGSNYLITVGEAQIQVSYPTEAQGTTLTALDGKTVHVKGYFSGINSSSKFTIMLESVEEVASTEPTIILNPTTIEVGAEECVGQITMTLTNLTYEDINIEGSCNWVVLEVYDGYIEYTVEQKTGEERTAEFTVTAGAADPVTVTITQKKYALEYSWDLSKDSYESASKILVKWSCRFADMIAEKATANTDANNYLGGDSNNRTSSRFYSGSMLTITPAKGYAITGVVFTATTEGYATALVNSTWNDADAVADQKTVTVTRRSGIGEACDLVAQIGGTCGFTNVTVYVEPANCEAITVTDAGYATYVTKNDVEFDEDVAFKAIATKDQVVTFEPITSVPAGTPVLLVGTENQATTIIANIIDNANTVTGNLLKASDGTVLGNGSIYALAKKDEVVGFYKVSENAPVYYGKCYLELGDGAREFLAIDNATTGVQSVAASLQQAGQLFDLQGRQVQQPAKGLYIQNGKKIVVR